MPARNVHVVHDTTAIVGLELIDEPVAAFVVFVVSDDAVVTGTVFVFVFVVAFVIAVVELRRFRSAERRIVVVVRDALEGHRLVIVGRVDRRPEVQR